MLDVQGLSVRYENRSRPAVDGLTFRVEPGEFVLLMGGSASGKSTAMQAICGFIPEIIHPQTGEVLPYGTPGELVFTTITKEAFPVIRYRTRDLSVLHPEPCRCGRTIVRMGRIQGRSDDMLIIRGVNVFPSQIESVIIEAGHFEPHYQLVVDRTGNMDQLTVRVEVNEAMFSDEIRNLQTVERELERTIRETLGVTTRVKLVEPKGIERSEGKAVRVIDNRKI